MKSKILLLIATAMLWSVSLLAQRDPTTGHSVTTDVSIKAYIFGGQKSDGSLSNELWTTNEFGGFVAINAPGGPSPRKNHDAWMLGNLLYIRGGVDANGNCIADLWEFNLLTNTWTQYPDYLPMCAYKKTAVKNNNNVYIAGGSNSSGASVSNFGIITSSGYTPKADMIEPLAGCGGFKKNGDIYIFGGKNHDWDPGTPGNQPSYSQNVWKYSVATNGWTLQPTTRNQIIELTDMAYTQDNLENFFYVFGGKTYDYTTNTELYSNGIYRLDLNTFSWSKYSTNLPYGLAEFTATYKQGTNFNTDTVFLLGGRTATGALSTNLFKFVPATGQLISVSLPTSINYPDEAKVTIYPDPASDVLYIRNAEPNSIIRIYDMAGKILMQTTLNNEQLNISELKSGLYFISINSGKTEAVNKFVKTE